MNRESKNPQDNNKLEGRYANYFKIGYNAFAFVFDLGQFYPDNGELQIHTRIITSPMYAKVFLETFQESIEQYEQTFEVIR